MKQLRKTLRKQLKNGSEEINKLLEACDMSYNEFLSFYVEHQKKEKTILNWKVNLMNKINKGEMDRDEINTNSKEFTSKYNKYKQSEEFSERYKLLTELQEIYINYLKDKATIEYVK